MVAAMPRVFEPLWGMLEQPITQCAALKALLHLAEELPHSLRGHFERLSTTLPPLLLASPPATAAAAGALLGALPGCMGPSFADCWLLTVQKLAGTLQAATARAAAHVGRERSECRRKHDAREGGGR